MNQPFSGRYRARCTKVVDGDTIDVVVDLGFHLTATMRIRLWGINTAEMKDKDPAMRKQAQEAKEFVLLRVPPNFGEVWPLRIETLKDPDNFGRWLAKVWYKDPDGTENMINDELVSIGLATEFMR
jgi:micrococcal nuclease